MYYVKYFNLLGEEHLEELFKFAQSLSNSKQYWWDSNWNLSGFKACVLKIISYIHSKIPAIMAILFSQEKPNIYIVEETNFKFMQT